MAQKIVERDGLPFISTDSVVHMINDSLPGLNIMEGGYNQIPANFYPFLKALIKYTQYAVKDYVIEGDAFFPRQVNELNKEFKIRTCFLGFSHVTLRDIQEDIGHNNWIDDLAEKELHTLPDRIIEASSMLKSECEKYDLRYIDLTGNYLTNLEKAYRYLLGHQWGPMERSDGGRRWLHCGRARCGRKTSELRDSRRVSRSEGSHAADAGTREEPHAGAEI